MPKRSAPGDWRQLQEAVAQVLSEDGYTVSVERTMPTARSSVTFDVFAQKTIGGHSISIAVECKHWAKNVPQVVVHGFRAQLDDLGADAGYIISSAGFQSGAYDAAEKTSIRLMTWEEFLGKFAPEGPPLGLGLRGSAQIVNGLITFSDSDGSTLPWVGSIITGGFARRDESGQLLIVIKTEAPMPGMQRVNNQIGWEGLELRSPSDELSVDPKSPTAFIGEAEFTTPAGMQGLHPQTGEMMTFPAPLDCKLLIQAMGILRADIFAGNWSIAAHCSLFPHPVPLRGSFSVRLV